MNITYVVRCLVFFLLFFISSLYSTFSLATISESESKILLTTVREKVDSLKNKSGIDETLRLRMLDAYYDSEDNIEELIALEKQIQEIQQHLKNLPAEIKQYEKSIGAAEYQFKKQIQTNFSKYPIDELEQRLIIEQFNQNGLQATISRLTIEIAEQQKQQQHIRAKITEIKNNRFTIQREQTGLEVQVNTNALDAYQTQLDSQLRRLNAMLTKLELENLVYPLTEQAQKLELQLLNLQNKQLTKNIEHIDNFLTIKRQQEINTVQGQLIRAQKESEGKHPAIQMATKQNIRYYDLLQKINDKLEIFFDRKNEIDTHYLQLEKDFKSAEQKIDLAGLSPALGNLLREQRRKLPLMKNYQSSFGQIQKEIALASLKLFQLDENNRSLQDTDQALLSRITATEVDLTAEEKLTVRTELRPLLINQKELVLQLSLLYSEYSRTLADVDFSLHQLVKLGNEFSHYLSQRLLWVPSAPEINQYYFSQLFESSLWFIKVPYWLQTIDDLKNSIEYKPLLVFFAFSIVILLLWFRRTIKHNLQELLKNSSKPYVDRFSFTFYGLGYVFLLVLPFSIIVISAGWLLYINAQATPFSHSVAQGLMAAAVPLFTIQFFYCLFRSNGLVQSMFFW